MTRVAIQVRLIILRVHLLVLGYLHLMQLNHPASLHFHCPVIGVPPSSTHEHVLVLPSCSQLLQVREHVPVHLLRPHTPEATPTIWPIRVDPRAPHGPIPVLLEGVCVGWVHVQVGWERR